jgi:hypothetical protein
MNRAVTFALVITASSLTLAAAHVPARADRDDHRTLRGAVLALPDTADRVGEWRVGDRVVQVDAATVVEEQSARTTEGHWAHLPTGALVHAPAWHPDLAHAAGFRRATPAEVGGVTLGSVVEVKLGGALGAETPVASKVEVKHP